jgi:hypothetical protein
MKTTGCVFEAGVTLGATSPPVGILYDLSRFRNNGTITGPTWVRLPSGLWVNSFDGTDDVINCGTTTSLNNIGTTGDFTFTILCWTKWTGRTATYPSLFNKQIGATELGIRMLSNNSDTTMLARLSSGGVKYKDATIAVSQNIWHLVGLKYNGANTIALCDTNSVTGSAFVGGVDDHSSEAFCIGNNAAVNQDYLGYIGLFRIWNRALSAGKINQIYQAERGLFRV